MEKDFSKIDKAIEVLSSIRKHREENPTSKAEYLWYKYYADTLIKVRKAWENDEFIVGTFDFIPAEICYAMDLPFIGLAVYGPGAITVINKLEEESLNAARQLGLLLETCSGWRMTVGLIAKHWFPKLGTIVSANTTCDTCNKIWQLMANLEDIPGYMVDVPFPAADPKNLDYVRDEMAGLISFLEEASGHKMDLDKLRECVIRAQKMVEINLEIRELIRAKPTPITTRMTAQSYWINWLYSGLPEGVAFLEALRDELKDRVERGVGGSRAKEKYRLLAIPPSPQTRGKTMNWLAKEYGVVTVASTFMFWKDIELNTEDPIMGITQKFLHNPINRQFFNPCESEEGIVTDTLNSVEELGIDGVIIWGNPACDATSGWGKIMRDRLEEVNIPSAVMDHDPADITYTPEDTLKEMLEEFVDLLE